MKPDIVFKVLNMIEDDDIAKGETEKSHANANDALTTGVDRVEKEMETGHMAKVEAAAAENDAELPPIPDEELERLRRDITAAIKTVYDPEIPVDIYELGLIYRVDIENDRSVHVEMTLTSPGCPVAGDMPGWVVDAVLNVDGVKGAKASLSFDPPWDMSMMSDEARFGLNMF